MADHLPAEAQPSRSRWWICGLLLLATTLNYMDRVTLNQTSARIQFALQLSNEQYGWLEGVFAFAFAAGTLITGFIVDRVSVRWVYPVVVAGWSLAGFLTGFAPGYMALLGCRCLLGLFEAGNWPCGIRTTRQVMPPKERSLGNALFQSGTALGAVITPYLVFYCLRFADPGEPVRNAHFALGGGGAAGSTDLPPEAWRFPFMAIGAVGILWLVLWIFTVPTQALRSVEIPSPHKTPFTAIFADRRFWILVVVIMGVNTTWHTFRVWLPLFLQKERGYSEAEMTAFTTIYYLTADIGSWTVGLVTLWLSSRGWSIHGSRMVTYVGCAVLAASSLILPWAGQGTLLTIVLLATAFGALGLFATYFALSQELSAQHQGKVTGTLGCINALYLGVVFPSQGRLIDLFGSSERILSTAAVPALIAVLVTLLAWRNRHAQL